MSFDLYSQNRLIFFLSLRFFCFVFVYSTREFWCSNFLLSCFFFLLYKKSIQKRKAKESGLFLFCFVCRIRMLKEHTHIGVEIGQKSIFFSLFFSVAFQLMMMMMIHYDDSVIFFSVFCLAGFLFNFSYSVFFPFFSFHFRWITYMDNGKWTW